MPENVEELIDLKEGQNSDGYPHLNSCDVSYVFWDGPGSTVIRQPPLADATIRHEVQLEQLCKEPSYNFFAMNDALDKAEKERSRNRNKAKKALSDEVVTVSDVEMDGETPVGQGIIEAGKAPNRLAPKRDAAAAALSTPSKSRSAVKRPRRAGNDPPTHHLAPPAAPLHLNSPGKNLRSFPTDSDELDDLHHSYKIDEFIARLREESRSKQGPLLTKHTNKAKRDLFEYIKKKCQADNIRPPSAQNQIPTDWQYRNSAAQRAYERSEQRASSGAKKRSDKTGQKKAPRKKAPPKKRARVVNMNSDDDDDEISSDVDEE